jgi:hypothetical protein
VYDRADATSAAADKVGIEDIALLEISQRHDPIYHSGNKLPRVPVERDLVECCAGHSRRQFYIARRWLWGLVKPNFDSGLELITLRLYHRAKRVWTDHGKRIQHVFRQSRWGPEDTIHERQPHLAFNCTSDAVVHVKPACTLCKLELWKVRRLFR